MLKKIEYICVFLSGGIIYSFIEVAWRGYTHWSMTIAGGICFMLHGSVVLPCYSGVHPLGFDTQILRFDSRKREE